MSVGASKCEIETPALLVDLNAMEGNINKMSRYFSSVKSNLRAHAKTHKSPIIAHKQIEAGAIGICCQKLGEAEVMAENGVHDILITSEVVDPEKIERLVGLSRHSDIKVIVDNLEVARIISETARKYGVKQEIMVEVDIGLERCGVMPGRPTLEFVREIIKFDGLNFRGLMGYEGAFFELPNFEERKTATLKRVALLTETVEMLEDDGINVDIVSAGSTGTHNITGEYPRITEVEAGSYVFMDSTYSKLEGFNFKCALTVLATVISRPVPHRIITNVGLKAITKELGMPLVKDVEDVRLFHLSEEHGWIEVDPKCNLKVGDKIELIPSHCCTTVNLHERYYGLRDDTVEVIWPITARGRFQ